MTNQPGLSFRLGERSKEGGREGGGPARACERKEVSGARQVLARCGISVMLSQRGRLG